MHKDGLPAQCVLPILHAARAGAVGNQHQAFALGAAHQREQARVHMEAVGN